MGRILQLERIHVKSKTKRYYKLLCIQVKRYTCKVSYSYLVNCFNFSSNTVILKRIADISLLLDFVMITEYLVILTGTNIFFIFMIIISYSDSKYFHFLFLE